MNKLKTWNINDRVRTVGDFTAVRELYTKLGFRYPEIGEVLTITRVGSHPLAGHQMLYFDGYRDGISDIGIDGPNFELVTNDD
ncbi:MAG: hypothetical protein IPK58_22200 [Acidobacteria bacterium]|nr:hypothetical protein [Acidobacteriota bacterium]